MLVRLAFLVAPLSAFMLPAAPQQHHASKLILNEKSKALPFAEKPEALDGSFAGDVGFDPLGFTNVIDIKWLREAELKHGRICQLAWVGFVATDLGITLPGDMHKVSSVAAHDVATQYGAMQQLLLWISLVEIISTIAVSQMMWEGSGREPGTSSSEKPTQHTKRPCSTCTRIVDPAAVCPILAGDFGLDPLLFTVDPEKKADMQLKEITHCRLAMVAFSGVVTQAVLTGKGFPYY